MPAVLQYGLNSKLAFDLPKGALIAHCEGPHDGQTANLAEAVTAALAEPLDYPALARATVPGDKVVLALDQGLPHAGPITAAVVQYLVGAGVTLEDITILRTQADVDAGGEDPRNFLPTDQAASVAIKVHNPQERDQLAMLGRAFEDRPVYLNRLIHDADVVVPIGCLKCSESVDYHGVYGGVFPLFADAKTQQRFRNPGTPDSRAEQVVKMQQEVDQVGWMLGAQFTVQLVPGPTTGPLRVLAGESRHVFTEGRKLCLSAWNYVVPQRASLVVAAVTGDRSQQTWRNVGRALAAASAVVGEDGAIALCTELEEGLGPAMQSLIGAESSHDALRRIRKDRPEDAVPAAALAEALGRARVYLHSRLDDSLVEDLGMAPISGGDDVARLVRRHPSCILLGGGQYVQATVEGD
jgi:nickel-dependent lactate racemase